MAEGCEEVRQLCKILLKTRQALIFIKRNDEGRKEQIYTVRKGFYKLKVIFEVGSIFLLVALPVHIEGLKEVLTKIQELFVEIASFLERVGGYRCHKAMQFIKTLLQEYRQIQKLFTRYSIQLHRLRENLNDMILDALFLGMGNFDMQKQFQKACTDLQNDFHSFRNVLTKIEEKEEVPIPDRQIRAGVGSALGSICCPCFRKKSKPPDPYAHLEPEVHEAVQLLDDYEKLLYRELSEELIRSF